MPGSSQTQQSSQTVSRGKQTHGRGSTKPARLAAKTEDRASKKATDGVQLPRAAAHKKTPNEEYTTRYRQAEQANGSSAPQQQPGARGDKSEHTASGVGRKSRMKEELTGNDSRLYARPEEEEASGPAAPKAAKVLKAKSRRTRAIEQGDGFYKSDTESE
jgi:hypothetical protein